MNFWNIIIPSKTCFENATIHVATLTLGSSPTIGSQERMKVGIMYFDSHIFIKKCENAKEDNPKHSQVIITLGVGILYC
jgi:hypothetical protein